MLFKMLLLTVNFSEDDLKKYFEKTGQLTQFKEKYLRVESNCESVRTGFGPEIAKNIPLEIKNG